MEHVDDPLEAGETKAVSENVLVETQLAAGTQHTTYLRERRILIGDRAQHERTDCGVATRVVVEVESVVGAHLNTLPSRPASIPSRYAAAPFSSAALEIRA